MAVYPTHQFSTEEIKLRYGERYISQAANYKTLGFPLGVYFGFVPTLAGSILTLSPDPSMGLSGARVISQDDPLVSIDVISRSDIEIDFTDHTTFPVNLVLKANGALGAPFSAEIVTQVAPPIHPTELLLGVLVSAGTFNSDLPTNRSNPFAYTGAPLGYGFMPSGSVEELLAAVAMISEVSDARTDLAGVAHANLKDRLDADAAGPAMASRLGLEIRTIISENYALTADAITVVVGNSFANKHRTNSPIESIPGFGSETKLGAVTDGSPRPFPPAGTLADDDRNVCAVIDTTTERRLVDSSRRPIYARLSLDEAGLTGQLDFVATSPTVNGTGTLFTSQVQKGDIIEDGAGDFYEVAADPTLDNVLTLSIPADNTNSITNSRRRRFTISFFVRASASSETPTIVPLGTGFRFFFPLWDNLEISQFDYLPELFKNFDGEPVANATAAIAGKVLVEEGATGAKGGAIWKILDTGSVVGDGNFYSINFGSVDDATGGVADVLSRGATGETGDPGAAGVPGPPGPQGPRGTGYDYTRATFFIRESSTRNVIWSGGGDFLAGQSYNFTYSFPSIIDMIFLTGGIALWAPVGNEGDDTIDITNIEKLSAISGRITGLAPTGGPHFGFRLFMNAGGTDGS